ncbi:hypothetical protein [Geomobilimonas luticola]|uniref:ResB-like domain-containing protein n=1 Tax=Geomobilimonas luticola TaxID=1114878 RepID=A0ABS5S9J4_9BACT|nr:hypothetical protein [Geomobilimonas luticola]MBT0652044.1 hypothetical protein [Geomobilimonas luticola]
MDRFYRFFSPLLIACLAFPMVLWAGLVVLVRRQQITVAFDSTTCRIFGILLAAVLLMRVIGLFWQRSFPLALVTAGTLVFLVQGGVNYGFRYTATAALGEEEYLSSFHKVSAGPWAQRPTFQLMARGIKAYPGKVSLLLDGYEHTVEPNTPLHWHGLTFKLERVDQAPLMVLRNGRDKVMDGAYIKLLTDSPDTSYFQFAELPHRFYATWEGDSHITWRQESGEWVQKEMPTAGGARAHDKLRLAVVRGKLPIAESTLIKDGRLSFEGYSLAFENTAPWVLITISRHLPLWGLYAGLIFWGAGGYLLVRSRRS